MIDSRMTDDDVVDFDNLTRPQEWRDNRFAGVKFAGCRASGIEQKNLRAWQLDYCGIAVPHIEMRHAQLFAVPALLPPIPTIGCERSRNDSNGNNRIPMRPKKYN